ncbi:hypothetical protein C7999DRAFT_36337 [Corynascus novoguineensis]|uniref:NAD(P)-binding domain-containing protein n=1 Tax=Corynascus novoguineensis TaxID=1126955 RepID=A0AAN7HIE4_9PEZI|nr:hypothetical protein C7999DRAFT_36337 [Corynascus novoguineensis]
MNENDCVTGYIGGDAVYAILEAHPEYEISCLVRDEAKGALVSEAQPSLRIVYGDLDDGDLLEEEAANTDIICSFAHATHEPSVQALARGLARRTRPGPGFFIHTMGTGTMIYDDIVKGRYGKGSNKIFNDLEGLVEVLSVPDFAKARGAENTVRQVGIQLPGRIKTAVVCTSSVYGLGRGILKYRPTAIHELVRATLQRKRPLVVGEGESAWRNVHVSIFRTCTSIWSHAVAGGEPRTGPAVWGGSEGFYFAEGGEHVWSELARSISAEAASQGFLSLEEPESIDPGEAAKITPMGQFFWGCNARVEGRRARQALNWQPHHPSLEKEIKAIVATEAMKLSLV